MQCISIIPVTVWLSNVREFIAYLLRSIYRPLMLCSFVLNLSLVNDSSMKVGDFLEYESTYM